MDAAGHVLFRAAELALRATDASSTTTTASATSTNSSATTTSTGTAKEPSRPGFYKIVGLMLAVCSGLFIGVSFVLKKLGLLKANKKYNEEAGEGYGYLKNWMWWSGMTLMILGEVLNFVAYAFTDAILVTPLGALSVVVTTILSTIFLKERLSFVGWVACFLCIVGSVMIALNAPEQSAVADIQEMQHFVISPGFLSYTGVIVIACVIIAFYVGPRYGKKSMLVYLSICSLIGGLSVVATQGLGAAIVAQIGGKPQFNQWFLYVLLVFVVGTLLTEIIYLNKALNLFNAAMVTPTYYVYFTSSTIVASTVLFQGLHGTAVQIVDIILGFLVICSGVVLLQLAKSAKDVPDSKVFSGDLDQVRTVAEVEEPEYEPRADTLRGGAGIVRAMSKIRTKRQVDEMKRIHDEMMEPIGENEEVEWDGLRRRKTVSTQHSGSVVRRKTMHPPLGMAHFPDEVSEPDSEVHPGFFGRIGRKPLPGSQRSARGHSPVQLDHVTPNKTEYDDEPSSGGQHVFGLPADLRKDIGGEYADTAYRSPTTTGDNSHSSHIHWASGSGSSNSKAASRGDSLVVPAASPPAARRQFSFQNVFGRHRSDASNNDPNRPNSRGGHSFSSRVSSREYPNSGAVTTEEERLGLVQGDSKVSPGRSRGASAGATGTVRRSGDDGRRGRREEEEEDEEDSGDEWQHPIAGTTVLSSSPERMDSSDRRQRGRRDRYDGHDDYDDEGSGSGEDGLYDAPLRSPLAQDNEVSSGGRGGQRGAYQKAQGGMF